MPYFRTDRRNKIYYELIENPEVSKTLVFVHGWAEHHQVWREQIEFFQDKYQLLLYDLRGFGLSSKPAYGYSLKLQSKYLHALIQTLNLTDYWVIGHSLGGMITLHYCEKFAEELNGAVLIDTTSFIPTKVTTLRSLGTFFISKTLRTIWQKTLKSMRTEKRRILIQNLIHDVESVPLYVSAACGISVLNSKVDLQKITCPIQIIVGADDALTPVDLSEKMHQKIPNSHLAIIPDTGHMSFIEKPEEINPLLAEFFQKTQ
jgi:3-oxoadipate enol-lactonase